MKHADFSIGCEFTTEGSRVRGTRWRCTDVGTRIIAAIEIEPGRDPSWYSGPTYAVLERVFDEDDFPGCEARK